MITVNKELKEQIIFTLIMWGNRAKPQSPCTGICNNLIEKYGLLISSNKLMESLGIDISLWPEAFRYEGSVNTIFPVFGVDEYHRICKWRGFTDDLWSSDSGGCKRRRLCLWMAGQMINQLDKTRHA